MEIGKTYFVRVVPHDYVGRVTKVDGLHVELEDASWVAESGRFSEFILNGKAEGMEIEPVGRMGTRYQSWIEWSHKLFTQAV